MNSCARAADADRKRSYATYQRSVDTFGSANFGKKFHEVSHHPILQLINYAEFTNLDTNSHQLGFTGGYKHITRGKVVPEDLAKINRRLAAAFTVLHKILSQPKVLPLRRPELVLPGQRIGTQRKSHRAEGATHQEQAPETPAVHYKIQVPEGAKHAHSHLKRGQSFCSDPSPLLSVKVRLAL